MLQSLCCGCGSNLINISFCRCWTWDCSSSVGGMLLPPTVSVLSNLYIYIYILKALVCRIFQEKKLVAEIKKTAKTGNEVSLFCGALVYWMLLLCKYTVWNLMETFGRGWVDFLLTYLLEFLKFASWCFMWYILVWTLNIFFFLELHDAMNVRMPKYQAFLIFILKLILYWPICLINSLPKA